MGSLDECPQVVLFKRRQWWEISQTNTHVRDQTWENYCVEVVRKEGLSAVLPLMECGGAAVWEYSQMLDPDLSSPIGAKSDKWRGSPPNHQVTTTIVCVYMSRSITTLRSHIASKQYEYTVNQQIIPPPYLPQVRTPILFPSIQSRIPPQGPLACDTLALRLFTAPSDHLNFRHKLQVCLIASGQPLSNIAPSHK